MIFLKLMFSRNFKQKSNFEAFPTRNEIKDHVILNQLTVLYRDLCLVTNSTVYTYKNKTPKFTFSKIQFVCFLC